MRLIDADAMLADEFEAYMTAQLKADHLTTQINEVVHRKIKKLILDTPSVEAEPVKNGRWIEHDKKTWCTLCGKSNKDYKPPFCPHCGARMDGKD